MGWPTDFAGSERRLAEKTRLKKSTLPVFISVLETLAEQGFIDVGPEEGEYDTTSVYNFLVISGLASREGSSDVYWLRLGNEDGCILLAALLKRMIYDKG